MFSFKVQEIGLLKKAPLPTQLYAIPCSHCKLLLQELLEAYLKSQVRKEISIYKQICSI